MNTAARMTQRVEDIKPSGRSSPRPALKRLGAVAAAWLLGLTGAVVAGEVSLPSLLVEMTDREALARQPAPAYVCLQSSSYDRKQKTAEDPAGWFANADHDQFLRVEQPRAGRNG